MPHLNPLSGFFWSYLRFIQPPGIVVCCSKFWFHNSCGIIHLLLLGSINHIPCAVPTQHQSTISLWLLVLLCHLLILSWACLTVFPHVSWLSTWEACNVLSLLTPVLLRWLLLWLLNCVQFHWLQTIWITVWLHRLSIIQLIIVYPWVSLKLISVLPSIEIIHLFINLNHLLNKLAECVWCIHPNKFFLNLWLQAIFK